MQKERDRFSLLFVLLPSHFMHAHNLFKFAVYSCGVYTILVPKVNLAFVIFL